MNQPCSARCRATSVTRPDFIFFQVSALAKTRRAKEKSEAMKQMHQKIAANPSGILMYHPPGRPFAFVKSLVIEFSTEVLQAILVVWLLAQTRIGSFAGRVGFVLDCWNSGRDNNQCFVLELVRFPWRLHRQLHPDRDCRFRSRWNCCRARAAKAQFGSLKLLSV